MNLTKKLITTCLVGFAAVFTGCITDGNDDEVSITNFALSATSAAGGQTVHISGSVKSDVAVTGMDVAITKDGSDAKSSFTVAQDAVPSATSFDIGKDEDVSISVTANANAMAGEYQITLTVNAGGTSTSKSATLTITGNSGTPVTESSISMGAQGHATLGSSLDADEMEVMLVAAARSASASIDLIFVSALNGTEARLYAPAEAKTDGFTLVNNWATTNATQFYKTSLTAAQYDAITTQEEIDDLWDDSKVLSPGELAVSGAMVVIVKTDQGKISLIKVESVSSQNTEAVLTAKGTK